METKLRENKILYKQSENCRLSYSMKSIVLPYLESYFEEAKYMLVKFYLFSCNRETFIRIAFENAYESSIIFQPLLYTNVPAESPSYTSCEVF